MIKSMIIAIAIAVPTNLLCAPILAEEVTSPKATSTAVTKTADVSPSSAMFSAYQSGESSVPPTMALWARSSDNIIACRSKARTKLFEIGARDMSSSDSNAQWGIVGSMRVLVWCRDTQVITSVAGNNYNSVTELRDEIQKAF